MSSEPRYRSEDWLETQFQNTLSLEEVADECGVTPHTIREWCKKFDVDYRPKWKREWWLRQQIELGLIYEEIAEKADISEYHLRDILDDKGLRSLYWEKHDIERREWSKKVVLPEEELVELFVHKRWTWEQIANYFDCGHRVVRMNLKEYGITAKHQPAILSTERETSTNGGGYTRWKDNKGFTMYVHRLLAVSEYGIKAVKEKHIHHKSIKWDNRPETIEPVSPGEHLHEVEEWPDEEEIHECPRDPNPKFTDREWLQEAMLRYESVEKIAEVCDRDTNEIQHWIDWFGVERHNNPLAF